MLICPHCGMEVDITDIGEVCTNCGVQIPLDVEFEEQMEQDSGDRAR